jgi:hypothetical protein
VLGMTTRKNHPSGLKRWSGKFSTMPKGILGEGFWFLLEDIFKIIFFAC